MTNVIFVRHAQAVYGEDDRNRPLTEEGLEDRKKVLETLKNREIDAFICSPYKRSMDTISPTAEYFNMQIHTDERLRERKAGSFEEGLLSKRWEDFSFAEEGGENLASVQSRNMEALKEILQKYEGKTVVIGTHGTALSTILNFYNRSFGLNAFLRIANRMPYIIELEFAGETLLCSGELAYVNKD